MRFSSHIKGKDSHNRWTTIQGSRRIVSIRMCVGVAAEHALYVFAMVQEDATAAFED
jgi:hypothetical protein